MSKFADGAHKTLKTGREAGKERKDEDSTSAHVRIESPVEDESTVETRRSRHIPSTTTVKDVADDPEADRFFAPSSPFRGPFDSSSEAATNSKGKSPQHSSWLGASEADGFFRRWVEEPLGLVSGESDELDAQSPSSGEPGHRSPLRSATAPKPSALKYEKSPFRKESQSGTIATEKSNAMSWDTAVRKLGLRRHNSLPHIRDIPQDHEVQGESTDAEKREDAQRPPASRLASRRWAMIKNRLAPSQVTPSHGPSSAVPPDVNISDELLSGGLATLMLRMHFERDEQDHRRVPVLLHHLKIRVSDSIHPLTGTHTVFRIECEYANGAARWVIYRELRDFVTLHTHYKVAKVYGRGDLELPEFPLTSLPYFKFLKSQAPHIPAEERRASFARLQRMHLENYLVALIKAVMFRPEANRLSRFFEISALSVALAKSGGVQGKSGLLRVAGGETSRRSVHTGLAMFGLGQAAKPRWWSVRESYLVAVDDPGDTHIYDVFLIDNEFCIEQPTRYYRKLDPTRFHEGVEYSSSDGEDEAAAETRQLPDPNTAMRADKKGTISLLSTRLRLTRPSKEAKLNEREKHETPHPSRDVDNEVPLSRLEQPADGAVMDSRTRQSVLTNKRVSTGKGKSMDVSQHTFYIQNSQRRLKLVAKNERQLHQWITSMEKMAARSHWNGSNRFDSFAPIRLNVAAQWLVDGRDYFWNLSRAISLAKNSIYIHDWWLSPELEMRRPNKPQYRIDHLLKRRAEAGVKIFVIVYKEVSNRTTPTDSNYTKQRLVGLHPNIMVQRSPAHFSTGTFYWAHHEKLCVIDEAIAFMGGLDMCFGRWDTPQHALVDDPDDTSDQIWPGKDYANERVIEFHTLTKPHEDMYDRGKVPRMPWHDVAVQILGQPARDLCRHFVQRWNYLLRVKTHSRLMPFLLPPAEFKPSDLEEQGLTGTCEVQICRSAGNWSMGLQRNVEHSIQNAYLKAIQMSEHFVYIENQFFITSTVINDIRIENQIGDALVSRIIRAHQEGTKWKACIVIPLLPGFTFPIDHSDASAVRLILECQNRTISRGPHSIFARLRKEGIDPNDYITFFSLRTWGKLRGDVLTTEQLYIHAKTMIVDDRLAIIGSANINERSQRGDRDSELASIIRDTDMIDSVMAGKPFKVGRFAHTLRIRLMREHLGIDVDAMYNEDLMANKPTHREADPKKWDPDQEENLYHGDSKASKADVHNSLGATVRDQMIQLAHGVGQDATGDLGKASRHLGLVSNNIDSTVNDQTLETDRRMPDRDGAEKDGFPSSVVPTLEEQTVAESRPKDSEGPNKPIQEELQEVGLDGSSTAAPPEAHTLQEPTELYGAPADASTSPQTDNQPPHFRSGQIDADDAEINAVPARKILRQHLSVKTGVKPWTLPAPKPVVDPHRFNDPVSDEFFKDVWIASATHNTEIFRKVFHCTPDDLVTTWKQYKEFVQHQERLSKPPKESPANRTDPVGRVPSEGATNPGPDSRSAGSHTPVPTETDEDPDANGSVHRASQSVDRDQESPETKNMLRSSNVTSEDSTASQGTSLNRGRNEGRERGGSFGKGSAHSRPRRPTHIGEPLEQWERDEMEELLKETCGHLVVYPLRFLEGEDVSDNFLFNADRLLPLPIYD